MKKRLGRSGASVDVYFRFKLPDVPNDKVKLWEEDMALKGRYMGQSVRGDFVDYVFEGLDGKVFSVNKTSAISQALEGVEQGSLIELVYGGKKKRPGGKSFHVVDVFLHDDEEGSESDPL